MKNNVLIGLVIAFTLLSGLGSADITCSGDTMVITEICKTIDAYNADIALGCGIITKQGNLQYRINGNIHIGNTTTDGHFISENEQIEWTSSNVWQSNSFKLKGDSTARFGKIVDGVPMDGSSIYTNTLNMWSWKIEDNSTLYLYATKITDGKSSTTYSMIRQATTSTVIGKEVILDGIAYGFYSSNTGATTGYHLDLENVVVQNCKYFFGAATDVATLKLKNIASHKTTNGMYIHSSVVGDVVMKNYIQTTGNYLFDLRVAVVDCYMINAITNTWLNRYSGGTFSKTYRQNTLNLKIVENGTEIPQENINITVTDKFNTPVFSHLTYPNGTIDEQIISYGYYNQAGGNNIHLYSPHTITLHHNDYQPRKISLNISEKINWKLEVYPTTTTTTTTTTITTTTTTTTTTLPGCYNKDTVTEEIEIGAQLTDVLACKLIEMKATSISPIFTLVLFGALILSLCTILTLALIGILAIITKPKSQTG